MWQYTSILASASVRLSIVIESSSQLCAADTREW